MKKTLLALPLLLLATSSVFAADGTITINGQVTDKTCTVNAGTTKDFTVTLPTVSQSVLAVAGNTAGRTPFTINLTGCTAGSKVATYFEPGATVDFNTGRLNNATGTATNVQVQLLGSNNTAIPVLAAGAGGLQTSSQLVAVADGSANLNYYAEYYATGASTPGTVATTVKYTIIYQ
uniref:fimbrial protein n=1 Tax=Psychrobacter sp. TaxID=56811 RepID=UPI00159787C3|nr:type 1 fimbrial protein [Psychrobacter sp.]QJS05751.1 pilus assembly protein, pilin FimA, ferrous iron transporter B [Psychrobacter sp.]